MNSELCWLTIYRGTNPFTLILSLLKINNLLQQKFQTDSEKCHVNAQILPLHFCYALLCTLSAVTFHK